MTVQILLAAGFAYGIWRAGCAFQKGLSEEQGGEKWILTGVFAAGFLLRLVLGYCTEGFGADMATFKAWANMVATMPLKTVYSSGAFLDYPPGYLYVLWLLEKLRVLLRIESSSALFSLFIKLPGIIADTVCAAGIYKLAEKSFGKNGGTLCSALYLFCPAVFINSAIWGQADSFCLTLCCAGILFLCRERYAAAGIFYGLSVICKPQMLIFAPIFLFFVIKKKTLRGALIGIGCAVAVMLLIALPFTTNFDYTWLVKRYAATMNYYNYYTINAYNLWGMLGCNWKSLDGVPAFWMTVLIWLPCAAATAMCGWMMLKSRHSHVAFAAGAVLMTTVYLFCVRMHERYLFPALLFLLLSFVFTRDKRLLYLFGGFATVHYLNVAYVLYLNNSYISPTSPVLVLLSAAHVALYGYLLYVVWRIYIKEQILTWKPVQRKEPEKASAKAAAVPAAAIVGRPETKSRRMSRADILAAWGIAILYGAVAFLNLGSMKTANTSWQPTVGESVTFYSEEPMTQFTFLPGIAERDHFPVVGTHISLAASADGESFIPMQAIDSAGVYYWKFVSCPEQLQDRCHYIKLDVTGMDTVLNEFGAKTADDTRCTLQIVSGYADALLDEQDVVPLYGTAQNSTYFDEIYHARTAYEYLLRCESYENTHPPLGKLLIAVGIALFGMCPFGWRFVGTLLGVLMLPVFYHLSKRLFGSTKLSMFGTALFALDFMHFTQTRIATIDTYAVFFILLMVDAMVIFMQQDLLHTPMKKLLLPLLCSGVFMGIGVACKWTVAYGGAGLAVLYFGKLYQALHGAGAQERPALQKRCLHLCLWCLLLFVAIPFGIYFAAFLPLTTLPHNAAHIWKTFCGYQTHMYNYHSGLEATHYFASPWYEWPLDIRPIWYFSNYHMDAAEHIGTICAMGNPLLWWSAIPALLWACKAAVLQKNESARVILVGFAAVYLPWVLVSRLTFIYHYFTAVPFLLLALCFAAQQLQNTVRKEFSFTLGSKARRLSLYNVLLAGFVAGNVLLFVLFYPVMSGAPTTQSYVDSLEWLSTWYFS